MFYSFKYENVRSIIFYLFLNVYEFVICMGIQYCLHNSTIIFYFHFYFILYLYFIILKSRLWSSGMC
jgi:hypothetical protein